MLKFSGCETSKKMAFLIVLSTGASKSIFIGAMTTGLEGVRSQLMTLFAFQGGAGGGAGGNGMNL